MDKTNKSFYMDAENLPKGFTLAVKQAAINHEMRTGESKPRGQFYIEILALGFERWKNQAGITLK